MRTIVYGYVRRHHIALLALFVALGGSSYAVTALPRNSVGPPQIKKGAVTSAKVKDGTLQRADFASGVLGVSVQGTPGVPGPQGAAGAPGQKGDTGATGAPGATNVVVRTQSFGSTPANVFTVFRVMCQNDERAVGGGAGFAGNGGNEELQQSYPVETDLSATEEGDTPAGWFSIIRNNNVSAFVSTGYAICVRP